MRGGCKLPLDRFIAVDWGTSRLRAYCCEVAADNKVQLLASATGPGVKKVALSFQDTLFNVIAPFTAAYGVLPIFMAGQISSSLGWFETGYLLCPIAPQAIKAAAQQRRVANTSLYVTPGLRYQAAIGHDDTMRGEELQLLGLLQAYPAYQRGAHIVCLPGTHCKWVLIVEGVVQQFCSAITGELFDMLTQHSVLLSVPAQTTTLDLASFTQGCQAINAGSDDHLIHTLFSVRTKQLFVQFSALAAASYLSGLLVGADVKAFLNSTLAKQHAYVSITVIGSEQLQQSYAEALSLAGKPYVLLAEQDIVLAGFAYVAGY
jgi:2-dehydro-3-deoxygalactonokinase